MRDDRGRVVVAAALAQTPGRGGHAWVVLSYLLGFRRLGWRVALVDRLPPDADLRAGVDYARAVLDQFGLADDYFLLVDGEPEPVGRRRRELRSELRAADFLLNVMGFLDDPELRADAPRRAFLDIDPGFPQMWADLGLADVVSGHDVYLTVGTNVGRPGSRVPTLGHTWHPTLPPVVMSEWPAQGGPGRAITTVATWRGPFDPIEHDGTHYGLRAHELRPLADLAARTDWPMEIALDIDPADRADRERLLGFGWRLVDPRVVAGTPDDYRVYVQSSTAEILVAKGMYVQSAGGWFSDRSACYLASGRPVIAQDTGFGPALPTGDGLLLFRDGAGAHAAIEAVLGRYRHHSDAARAFAAEYLDSDRVLTALVDSVLEPA